MCGCVGKHGTVVALGWKEYTWQMAAHRQLPARMGQNSDVNLRRVQVHSHLTSLRLCTALDRIRLVFW